MNLYALLTTKIKTTLKMMYPNGILRCTVYRYQFILGSAMQCNLCIMYHCKNMDRTVVEYITQQVENCCYHMYHHLWFICATYDLKIWYLLENLMQWNLSVGDPSISISSHLKFICHQYTICKCYAITCICDCPCENRPSSHHKAKFFFSPACSWLQ